MHMQACKLAASMVWPYHWINAFVSDGVERAISVEARGLVIPQAAGSLEEDV